MLISWKSQRSDYPKNYLIRGYSANALVITFNDVHAAQNITHQIRHHDYQIPVLVRCKDEAEFEALKDSGATKVITEQFERKLIACEPFVGFDTCA